MYFRVAWLAPADEIALRQPKREHVHRNIAEEEKAGGCGYKKGYTTPAVVKYRELPLQRGELFKKNSSIRVERRIW